MESVNHIKHKAAKINRKSHALLAYTVLTVTASMLLTSAKAQTFSEWFAQKKTQKKYLMQQIAALQVYANYLRQGYGITHNGLSYISGSLKSEFDLHSTYYNKLQTVITVVKNNPQVGDILTWQQDILTRLAELNKAPGLSEGERNYVQKVKAALLTDCNRQMNDLQNLLTSGKLQMSDEERLTRLTQIHTAMQDNNQFTLAFTGEVSTYLVQRGKEAGDFNTTKKLYGFR